MRSSTICTRALRNGTLRLRCGPIPSTRLVGAQSPLIRGLGAKTGAVDGKQRRWQSSAAASQPVVGIEPIAAVDPTLDITSVLRQASQEFPDQSLHNDISLALTHLINPSHPLRIAITPLSPTDPSSTTSSLLDAILVDPLSGTSKHLYQRHRTTAEGTLIRYGPVATLNPLCEEHGALSVLEIPHPFLQRHNLEIVELPAPSPKLLAEIIPTYTKTVYTTTSPAAFYAFTPTPTLSEVVLDIDPASHTLLKTAGEGRYVVSAHTALTAAGALELSPANASTYSRDWLASNITPLLHSLPSSSIRALLDRIIARCEFIQDEERRMSAVAEVGKGPVEVHQKRVERLLEAGRAWASTAHAELEHTITPSPTDPDAKTLTRPSIQPPQPLTELFTGRLAFWKLLWRVDEVGPSVREIVYGQLLPRAERELVYLYGTMALLNPDSSSAPKIENNVEEIGAELRAARAELAAGPTDALARTAQGALLKAGTLTAASAASSAILTLALDYHLYPSLSPLALGLVTSLYLLQSTWLAAKTDFERYWREIGAQAVRREGGRWERVVRGVQSEEVRAWRGVEVDKLRKSAILEQLRSAVRG
ncbi:hypothetical protein SAICODRAFT_24418 [Saitoella complicata NRRL Y-17804]|uniref:Mmc1 C-terminal domain-containing protein n=1 Tax=Saitoella complicata (strain BCRC 22490 / CBS 7301 / JCM 7358 / NBRC 10748 / NRRL Y-17804) TaxID=698492 RepID=A0A0E9NH09_SAICN|nr:uncharacterized protein SAICODRAFT_24418 [Saitoella complicata NRRL Y-17804]ODQ54098.1 hypothetical protein SAICODRAFT_24418 [Saitoella complicata NRRL Y-17804]GAO49172.1 hypothetical protein G7K_3330-t1 [Saitoella complicata NRRL Y-17804]